MMTLSIQGFVTTSKGYNFLKRIKDKIGLEIMNLIFSFFKKLKKRIGVKVTKKGVVEIYWKKNQLANIPNNKMNPINGFPIIDENPYREDLSSSFDSINPATGLPTSNGIDVGGNPYGIDLSSSFDHSFQDLGNSYHNDFHHN